SAAPDAPFATAHATIHRILDIGGHRSMQELRTEFRGEIPLAIREVETDSTAFTLELSTRTLYPVSAAARGGGNEAGRGPPPQLLVTRAEPLPDTALGPGSRTVGNRSEDAVCVREPGQEDWLWLDRDTHRLASLEIVRHDPSGHATLLATRYEGYAP